ncbi:hypothetical protein, partial [Escherichia coli]|uniref:hypothetical protein n=1 Tax=Escherichia coli TaxID=562 RepID=UPI001E3A95D2
RQYALTALARKKAEQQLDSTKPKKSADWLAHNDKKLKTLAAQMALAGGLREIVDADTCTDIMYGLNSCFQNGILYFYRNHFDL